MICPMEATGRLISKFEAENSKARRVWGCKKSERRYFVVPTVWTLTVCRSVFFSMPGFALTILVHFSSLTDEREGKQRGMKVESGAPF